MQFSYGKAPFFILLLAIGTGLGVLWSHSHYSQTRPDLVLVTHARLHADVYRAKLPEFERRYGVKVDVQDVDEVAVRTRLLAAFAARTEVPDLVEIPQNAAVFLRGPVSDLGFLDLTDWVKANRLEERMLASRFSLWQRKGVIFALPHDVHPVMLAYRADIVEGELGIDVSKIETWDDFTAMAQTIVRDRNGDALPDRFALEMPEDGGDMLAILIMQRGGGLFDAEGRVAFDDETWVDVVLWYLHQLYGPKRIGYSLGQGQALWQGMLDGVVVFYFAPDWRSRTIEEYAPTLAGKMKLMPLPAWTKGGRRTSTWGATGLAATKGSLHPALAKKLMEFLYVDQTDDGRSAADLHILPPVRATWKLPAFDAPSRYYSGQAIMRLYADLAPEVPPTYASPFIPKAQGKSFDAFLNCAAHYRADGETGLREFVRAELKRQADGLRQIMARDVITGP